MKGAYQHYDEQHLYRYLAEYKFRYTNQTAKGVDDRQRADNALLGIIGKQLPYNGLISPPRRVAGLTTSEFSRYVDDVLRTPKVIVDSIDWTDKQHGDYVACKLPVYAPEMPHFRIRLDLLCHVRAQPMRCSFSLLFTQRIFSLDVNPGLTHTNRSAGKRTVIRGTHWTRWPCEIAEPDARILEHQQWFNQFLQRANISFLGRYDYPPYLPEQIGLGL